MPLRLFIASVVFTVLGLSGIRAASGPAAFPGSPFLPPGKTAISAPVSPTGGLQLAGISVIGEKIFVSLFDPGVQRSRWIAVGNSVDGVEVVSCDPAADQALVRVDGQTKLLSLRKSSVGTALLDPPKNFSLKPSSPLVAVSTAPLTVQEQEREARMFVSDLLEIGLQQRKAYEELQRKAAAEAAAKKKM